MKIILTCGHPFSKTGQAEKILQTAGMKQALPSRREGLSAIELQDKIIKSNTPNSSSETVMQQIRPGRTWQELAVDLFIANQDQDSWGWADPKTVYLLDFWLEFDPQTTFVLVYSSPEYTLGEMLSNSSDPEHDLPAAVKSWVQVNSEMLSFYNRHPQRAVLANSEAIAASPGSLVTKTATDFLVEPDSGLFDVSDFNQTDAALTAALVRPLLHDFDELHSLYLELESAADISMTGTAVRTDKTLVAWNQYIRMLRWKDELRCQVTELQKQLEQLAKAKAEVETLAEARKAELEAASKEKSQLKAGADGFKSQLNESAKENELLLLQLHQVQEELEQYFLMNRELQQQTKVIEETPPSDNLMLDLRQEFDGDNWYYPEEDGRWAGPDTLSTIRIPTLLPGRYTLQFSVVDAMSMEIAQTVAIRFNNKPLEVQNIWSYKGLFKSKQRYPLTITSQLTIHPDTTGSSSIIQLEFSSLISPAERGSDDKRSLAIRVRSLEMKRIG